MFLRCKVRRKDGKQHRYWSVVENTRVGGGRVVQRHVLYLGEINDTQELAWRRSIAVLEDGAVQPRTLSLFPEDRCEGLLGDASIVRVKLSELRLRRPRQWGACWLALLLWRELQLDQFWCKRLGMSRKGTRWDQVLFVLVAYRLLAPGSEWRLHREWFQRSALADLLGEDAGLAEIHKLYRCHDRLLVHKQVVFDHLVGRWRDLFNISYDVLLYDLTSTYFEADPPFPEGDKRRFGYSRDHRPDCVQIVIALVVTPEGLPLAYEVLPGNTADKTTLRGFLERIERQYGKARRVWLMDRGVPTEEVLAEMRAADPPVHYLVGTPKGRLTRLEKHLVAQPWQEARPGVQVKLLPQQGELYVLAQSRDRVAKERAIRRRQLKRLWARLKQLSTMEISREELLMKLGAARDQSRSAWRLVDIKVAADSASFSYRLDRNKLRQARSREGRYLLRTNLVEEDPAKLWSHYTVGCGRGGVQEPQRRPRDPAHLSPARGPHRGARLHSLPGLLPAGHSCAARACAGARADAAQCAGEVRRCADDRRAPPDHRRPRAGAHPLYRARTRAQPPAEEAETGAARPTTTQNHRQRTCATHPDVVPTFGGPFAQSQILRSLKVLESAKLG
jgi:hypothetical protein